MKLLKFLLIWAESSWFGSLYAQKYCPLWNAALSNLINKHGNEAKFDRYTTTLGGVLIWTGSPFYSYGHILAFGIEARRPSLFNMYRLWLIHDSGKARRDRAAKDQYALKMREIANG